MNRNPAPKVEREDGAVALVDGDQGPGQVAGVFATDLSIELARRHGAGVVAVHRSSHYGAAGYYAIRAAEAGMVGDVDHELRAVRRPLRRRRARARHQPDRARRAAPRRHLGHRHGHQPGRGQQDLQRPRRGPPDPRGLGRRRARAAPPPTRTRSTPPSRSAATRATRSRVLVEVLSGVLSGSGVGHGIGRLYEDQHPQDVGHFHLAIDVDRLAGRERGARAARPPARRPQGDPARARPRRGARARRARGAQRRPSASATASRCRPRSGRR